MATKTLEVIINEEGAFVFVIRNWLADWAAKDWCQGLIKTIPWGQITYNYGDKVVPAPRLMYALVDSDLVDTSIGIPCASWDNNSNEWITGVRRIRDSIVLDPMILDIVKYPIVYDSCWLNYYRNGKDSISPHSDKEAYGPLNIVSGLSLGATRTFTMRHKRNGKIIKFKINNGDFMMMGGDCQQLWTHGIEKEYAVKEPRVSLTFRQLID